VPFVELNVFPEVVALGVVAITIGIVVGRQGRADGDAEAALQGVVRRGCG
jgi:hypothetical protein